MGFKCPFCFLKCADAKSLIEHLRSHNLVGKSENKSIQAKKKVAVSLPPCYVKLTRCDHLITRKQSSIEQSAIKPRSKLQKDKRKREKQTIKYVKIRSKEGKLLYRCPICSKVSRDRSKFENHFRTHTGEKPFVCEHCNRAFSQLFSMKVHIRRKHTSERPFACVQCDRSYLTSGELNQHARAHTGEKPFVCEHCNRAFFQLFSMKVHIKRKHTSESPFACVHCDRSFFTSGELNQHARVHTGEKPYACKYCSKAFAWSSGLNQHMRTHIGEKSCNKCLFCNYICALKPDLSHHYVEFHKLVDWKPSI